MPYQYLDDLTAADVAFRAEGDSLEEVFSAAWEATLGVMIELPEDEEPSESGPLTAGAGPGTLRTRVQRRIALSAPQADLLLHALLEEQVYLKDAEGLLLRLESCRVEERGDCWQASAVAAGERIDPVRHHLGTDVKAVTWHRFELLQQHGRWRATVILDV